MPAHVKEEARSQLEQLNDRAQKCLKGEGDEADRLAAIKAAQNLIHNFQTPEESIIEVTYSSTHFLCLQAAIELEVFKTLASKEGSVTLEEVASVKGADPKLVVRFLRVLSAIGYISQDGIESYRANEMTREMVNPHAEARVKFIWLIMPTLAKAPEFLRENGFKNVESATAGPLNYAEKWDQTAWEWFKASPDRFDACNTFMEADRGSRPSWLDWYPVKERIIDGFDATQGDVLFVDVAGGLGHDTEAFHRKFPNRPGRLVVEDLPHVIADIRKLDPSIERLSFNLFEKQPIKGARTYYLKFILHDWSDSDCLTILRNVASAMTCGYSKLVIEEFILDEVDCAKLHSEWDLLMLLFCGSAERTKASWEALLEKAGFAEIKFSYPPGDGQGIIEAILPARN